MDFLETILQAKEKEVALLRDEVVRPLRKTYSFYEFVKNHPEKIQLIGEVKRASPSKGDINTDINILEQAKEYETAGVAAISVLTEQYYFKGSIEDLDAIAQQVSVPILCKDFIIDEKQLIHARNAGATIILLIVAALSKNKLRELYEKATALGLEIIVEVHNKEELMIAHDLSAQLIGINNRNLKTFAVSLKTSEELASYQQPSVIYISESGFSREADVRRIKKNYQAILVGESLMREGNPMNKINELKVAR